MRGQGRDDNVGCGQAAGRLGVGGGVGRLPGESLNVQPHAVGGAECATGAGVSSGHDGDPAGPELSERREGGAGGGPRSEHHGLLDSQAAVRTVRRLCTGGLPQRADDTGDVGVEAGQERASCTAALCHHGVDGADGLGERIDDVQVRQKRLLVGHGDAQARPGRTGLNRSGQLGEQGRQRLRVGLAPLVGPVVQSEPGVGGPVQHG